MKDVFFDNVTESSAISAIEAQMSGKDYRDFAYTPDEELHGEF